jgi:hypothetical protein
MNADEHCLRCLTQYLFRKGVHAKSAGANYYLIVSQNLKQSTRQNPGYSTVARMQCERNPGNIYAAFHPGYRAYNYLGEHDTSPTSLMIDYPGFNSV